MTGCTQRVFCSFGPFPADFTPWHDLLDYTILLTGRRKKKDDHDDNVIEHYSDKVVK